MQAVDQNVRMMNNAFFSRMNFDGFNPTRALLFGGENKIPIFVRASGGKNRRLTRMKDQVRLAKLPSGGKRRRGRRCFRVTGWRAFVRPETEECNFLIREAHLALEFQLARRGQPRRHDSPLGDISDLAREFRGVLVGEQRKRASFSGVMARCAAAEEDGSDVAVEGDLLGIPGAVLCSWMISITSRQAEGNRQHQSECERQKTSRAAHGLSGRKQPMAGWAETGIGLPAMAAPTALASSCGVGAGRDRPNSVCQSSMCAVYRSCSFGEKTAASGVTRVLLARTSV